MQRFDGVQTQTQTQTVDSGFSPYTEWFGPSLAGDVIGFAGLHCLEIDLVNQ